MVTSWVCVCVCFVGKYLQDLLFLTSEKRSKSCWHFLCCCQSLCSRKFEWRLHWHNRRGGKSLPSAPADGVLFCAQPFDSFEAGGVERVSLAFYFVVNIDFWRGLNVFWCRYGFSESFCNCLSLFRLFFLTSYNTILAYCLTSSHFPCSVTWTFNKLINWKFAFYSVICYNSSSFTAIIIIKNIETPLFVHVGKFCRLFSCVSVSM